MAVLLHKWEFIQFKNIEVEFLKVNEKIWSPGLPDIGARKSWDFLILTVSASTVEIYLGTVHKNDWIVNIYFVILIQIIASIGFHFSKQKISQNIDYHNNFAQ